jgi:sRNA-binding regulator protein Hfq
MRKLCILLLVFFALLAQATEADTLHLKNGSILKGKVASFADDQFVVLLDTGSGRYLSRAMVYIGDVARIEFDGTANAAAAPDPTPRDTSSASRTNDAARVTVADIPRSSASSESPRTSPPAETQPQARETTPRETSPRETTPPETQPAPAREPDPQPEKPAAATPAPETADIERPVPERSTRKTSGALRTASIDVVGKRDWTSTGLIVKRGDRIRIAASGLVTLDPTNGRTCGPDGISDLIDPKKLMLDKPTGALIGVISSDNDDFIFIGRSTEFTATRDGLLFLSVNEGMLSDNTGSYKAMIELQAQKK